MKALGGDIGNSGAEFIGFSAPYSAELMLRGVSAMLFHRWQSDAVEAKAAAVKGSKAKKTDDVESYLWRDDAGVICVPGEYLRATLSCPQGAAKYRQDPRSPRKSALDLFKSGVVPLTELAQITKSDGERAMDADYVDRRRVTVQRAGITRERPAFRAGWTASFIFQVLLPEYISPDLLQEVVIDAGRFVGLGDFRPTYGRFVVEKFAVL